MILQPAPRIDKESSSNYANETNFNSFNSINYDEAKNNIG